MVLQSQTGSFETRNGLFQLAKWAVLQVKTYRSLCHWKSKDYGKQAESAKNFTFQVSKFNLKGDGFDIKKPLRPIQIYNKLSTIRAATAKKRPSRPPPLTAIHKSAPAVASRLKRRRAQTDRSTACSEQGERIEIYHGCGQGEQRGVKTVEHAAVARQYLAAVLDA